MEDKAVLERIKSLVGEIRFAMLTTETPSGEMVSRPMTTQQFDEKHSKVHFFAPKDSHACREVAGNPHVNLAYAEPEKSEYVSITGHASVVYDPSLTERLWNPVNEAWFPDGPKDPNIRVITVEIVRAEYWETKESKITRLFSYAKALLTGEQPNVGEHDAIGLNPAGAVSISH